MNEEVAIKLEPNKAKHPQLLYESQLYFALQGGSRNINLLYSRYSNNILVWQSREI